MKKITRSIMAVIFALLMVNQVLAGVSLNAARIGAEDVPALGDFYKAAFGLHEVNRLEFPGVIEIMLNFGDTGEAAKVNGNAQVVIMSRESDNIDDPVPHLIFGVTDINSIASAVRAAGGKIDGDPRQFGETGIFIALGTDPAGNRFELIQFPAQ